MHHLPQEAAYNGPQVVVQVLPCQFGPQPPAPEVPQQQQQQQLDGWCVLPPTAALLTELMPLLTCVGLKHLQQQQSQWQQQQQPAAFPNRQPPSAFTVTVQTCLKGVLTVLLCAVVPVPAGGRGSGLPQGCCSCRHAAECGHFGSLFHAVGSADAGRKDIA